MQNLQTDIISSVDSMAITVGGIIPKIPTAIIVLLAGYIFIRLTSRLAQAALGWARWPIGLQEIMRTLIRVILWVLLMITILQILGLGSVALALTGSLAILLLGFSSGISSTVSDLMAGLQLANDKDFKVGYKVKAGEQKTVGIIREMDIKKIRIEDNDGHLHVIPNSDIEKNEWVVLYRHVHSKMPSPASGIMQRVALLRKKEGK